MSFINTPTFSIKKFPHIPFHNGREKIKLCFHIQLTPRKQSIPTNNNKICQIENCGGNKLRCVSNILLMYFINAPTSKWHNVSCSWFIEFEGLERERERERECVCVCNVHMISTKSFHIPTFVCFTTVAIPGIPSHYILNTSSMYEVSCTWPYREAWRTSTIAYG
jgi:hypothetical protein